jgi:DNA-binding NtrC family response regulator
MNEICKNWREPLDPEENKGSCSIDGGDCLMYSDNTKCRHRKMMKKRKQVPNKLTSREVKHILEKFKEGKLNITKEADRLGVARRSIYHHLWSKGVLVRKPKRKTLWQRIKAYFGIQTYWEQADSGSTRL